MKRFFFNNKIKLYSGVLFFFSISINQYYGNIGINPIDSFFSFNAGYDILNGHYPFRDYWTITGPFIAFFQAFFFKLFGVNWSSYVFHASIFNFILTISTFYILYKLKLNIHYCFFYSFLLSFLAYPSSGTPYVDHHASYLSLISIFIFILAIKTDLKIYWFLLPIILGISFLSKQAPTSHIILIISLLSIFYFIFNYNSGNFFSAVLGVISFILFFFIILFSIKIPFSSFYHQYILYPISLGSSRLEFLFPLEFNRIILRFKLIHLSYLLLLIVIIKNLLKSFSYIKTKDFYILIALIFYSYSLILHQLMTINGLYIYFIIPVLIGFSHIYYLKFFHEKKYIFYFLIITSISSSIHYGYKYVHKRDFMDLRNAKIERAIDSEILDKRLKGLKWITVLYPEKPEEEIKKLSNTIAAIKKDKKNKIIITDYQFISVVLSIYDNSPSQVWFGYHVNPIKNSQYYEEYKNFVIQKIKENKIEIIYVVKPLWGGNEIIENAIEGNCLKKNNITDVLVRYKILKCKELSN